MKTGCLLWMVGCLLLAMAQEAPCSSNLAQVMAVENKDPVQLNKVEVVYDMESTAFHMQSGEIKFTLITTLESGVNYLKIIIIPESIDDKQPRIEIKPGSATEKNFLKRMGLRENPLPEGKEKRDLKKLIEFIKTRKGHPLAIDFELYY
jgi:hypothetical protein